MRILTKAARAGKQVAVVVENIARFDEAPNIARGRLLEKLLKEELGRILTIYESDNCTAWDLGEDGVYVRRQPRPGEEKRASQEIFMRLHHIDDLTSMEEDDFTSTGSLIPFSHRSQ